MPNFEKYSQFYDTIYAQKPYEREARFVLDWLPKKPKRILDLGCGTGKHALQWAKKGIKVLGVDQAIGMLDLAPKHKNLTWKHGSLPGILLNDEIIKFNCNCVTAMFNVMGYVDLENILRQLPIKKGGYFIFDIWDKKMVRKFPPKFKIDKFDDFSRVMFPNYIDDLGDYINMVFQIILVGPKGEIIDNELHKVKAYNLINMWKVCGRNGYEIVNTRPYERIGDWTMWYLLRKER